MKKINLILFVLLYSIQIFSQEEVMRIQLKDGINKYYFSDDIKDFKISNKGNHSLTFTSKSGDQFLVSANRISEINFFNVQNCSSYSGLHLGVMGFNDQVYDKGIIGPVYKSDSYEFKKFIDNLSPGNGTLLYHSVDEGLKKVEQYCSPFDLSNVSIITFTDGLDQGSWVLHINEYASSEEFLDSLGEKVRRTNIHNLPVDSYTVGLRGNDVSDVNSFTNNLKQLASSEDKVYEITNIANLNQTFSDIANSLSISNKITRYIYDMDLTLPAQSPGTKVRFTFDNISDGSLSNAYIEGVMNYDGTNFILENILYQGVTSTSGVSIQGTLAGINLTFSFKNIITSTGDKIEASVIKQWAFIESNGLWQVNSEFDPSQNINTSTREEQFNSSALVLLILDGSSSLGNDFDAMKTAAKNFIDLLLDGVGYPPTGPYINTNFALSYNSTEAYLEGIVSQENDYAVVEKGFDYSTDATFASGKINRVIHNDIGKGSYNSLVTNLSENTKYYFRSYAKTIAGEYYGNTKNFSTRKKIAYHGNVSDVDGNTYNTVKIGNQIWMAENLRATKFSDGTPIELIQDEQKWLALEDNNTDKAYTYNLHFESYPQIKDLHGAYYTFAAATNGENLNKSAQGVCPDGWHLPSENEWQELFSFIQNNGNSPSLSIKAASGWKDINGNDTYGFFALPTGGYNYSGNDGLWWNSGENEFNEKYGKSITIYGYNYKIEYNPKQKSTGLPVRCIKNSNSYAPVIEVYEASDVEHNSALITANVTETGFEDVTEYGFEYSTTKGFANGSGTKIFVVSGSGSFSYKFSSLQPEVTYYYKAFATNKIGTTYSKVKSFTTFPTPATDFDGNVYKTVRIGNQIWMAENLKATQYPVSIYSPIPKKEPGDSWGSLQDNNEDKAYYLDYYTYSAAVDGFADASNSIEVLGACPSGFHIPSVAEWNELIYYLSNSGYNGKEGNALKSKYGWKEWVQDTNFPAGGFFRDWTGTDPFEFAALPRGSINLLGKLIPSDGTSASFWTSTPASDSEAYSISLNYTSSQTQIDKSAKSSGYNIRCVKDQLIIMTINTDSSNQ
ncbi:FISUMP domain-containing protein [Saccharicrinis sp. FJH62]|uniref:FISUMP domain-containing protein n=1 Tax=Saccharicrinis sp. FJH62 TaxID=3344657 RepID=UPI0035D47FCC